MTQKSFIQKNLELSADFNAYVIKHPDFLIKLPKKGACVVFEIKSNESFTKKNLELARKAEKMGEKCFKVRKTGNQWQLEPLAAV